METMGHVFKSTRERKRISLSQAAAKTRIKLQHLEMMERDDFSRMPAPAYARGFIRMYADFLGLQSGPLIEEYNALHQPGNRARPVGRAADEVAAPAPPPASEPAAPPKPVVPPALMAQVLKLLSPDLLKRAAITIAALLLLGLVAVGISRCANRIEHAPAEPAAIQPRKGVPAVIQEPAEPYLPIPSQSGAQP